MLLIFELYGKKKMMQTIQAIIFFVFTILQTQFENK